MTQTKKNETVSAAKQGRPGQRQQERQQRLARARRRRLLWSSGIVAFLILIGAFAWVVVSARQNAALTAQQDAKATVTANQAAAAASKSATQTATAAIAEATATVQQLIKENPKGASAPPVISGTPQKITDGLEYVVIKPGTGGTIAATSTVAVEYSGWVKETGKKFDSSYDHGGQTFPVTLGQGQVIPGWDKGLVGMKIGETRRLIIGPALAYGKNDQKDQKGSVVIPGNSTLIFDITAVSFAQPQTQQTQQ